MGCEGEKLHQWSEVRLQYTAGSLVAPAPIYLIIDHDKGSTVHKMTQEQARYFFQQGLDLCDAAYDDHRVNMATSVADWLGVGFDKVIQALENLGLKLAIKEPQS